MLGRSRAKAATSAMARAQDKDRYVQPSPYLVDDTYVELVPQIVQQLVSYLEITGPTTEDLFGGDPSIRQINDLIDDLNAAGEHADVDQVSRGNPRLAAATLAAYIRQLPEPPLHDELHGALDGEVYVERIAALRDLVSEMSEAHVAVLHRIFYLLSRLAKAHAHGNSPEQLADLWAGLLTPATVAGRERSRASRVKDYRLVGLLLQHCACIFQGELDTLELPELPLPPHLEAEVTQERAKASQWQRIKGSLLRDSRGLFKIAIKEDGGGFYFDTIAQTDASDDRERLRPHDYLVSIGRKAVDEMTLPMVRGVIKEAGSMLEVEVRRYAPNEARGDAAGEAGELSAWKPQWHLSPQAQAHTPAEPTAALAFAADFDDAFAARFDEGVAAARAAAPQAEAGGGGSGGGGSGGGGGGASDEAFEQLRALCDQSQAAQQALLVCCVAYQGEIAQLEEEARATAEARRHDGHARGGEARGDEALQQVEVLQQAETLRKQNAALRAELRQQATALKQAQRDTASLAQQLRAATTS